jgi:hypothetical protein
MLTLARDLVEQLLVPSMAEAFEAASRLPDQEPDQLAAAIFHEVTTTP